jgi:Ca-activated chloride channel family protein
MKRNLLALLFLLTFVGWSQGKGLLIPEDKKLPPLAMLNHKVNIGIEDQVAITKIEQTFRNHTSRQLEATYVFPVPKGASVREFAMWVNGKKVQGELLEAAKAKKIYTDIVRQAQDPGLLEYIGSDLLSMKVFPILPHSDQKVEMSYTSVARKDHEIVEYVYPLKTDGKATATLEEFSLKMTLKSQSPIVNIYSPTHAVTIKRTNDKEAAIEFEKNQAMLDKDFQLFYTTSGKDVGLTTLLHRPVSTEDGHFMLLISPRHELSKSQQVPRDMVFVLDTSGSMLEGNRMDQAKKALKYCLANLSETDRFAVINFSTTVNRYRDELSKASKEQIEDASKWVDRLKAVGGTAINSALLSALELKSKEEGRTFTVVFFTDGKPTIGETNTDKILGNVAKHNTTNTRIFTFGVGHDLNAAFLDQLAERSRAVSTYVRPEEDIEVKVSSFHGKINHPVLANLKLSVGEGVRISEVYPPELPDLFHGDQLVVLGRYEGKGHVAIKLTGTVGMETKEFVYETDFQAKTAEKNFVEDLWARRKVGYLLDQIRLNGEKKELIEEVTKLAKKHGITTPYTSFLIVPDAPLPVASRTASAPLKEEDLKAKAPLALAPQQAGGKTQTVNDWARAVQTANGGVGGESGTVRIFNQFGNQRGGFQDGQFKAAEKNAPANGKLDDATKQQLEAKNNKDSYDQAIRNFRAGNIAGNQQDKQGVDLSGYYNGLKAQTRMQQTAYRQVANRNCMEIGGVWIDEGYDAKKPTVTVRAQSDAYFKILEQKPEVKDVFKLGNHLVWVTPNGTNLVIDTNDGKEQLSDKEIETLFVAKK